MSIANNVDPVGGNMVSVTVAPNKKLVIAMSGFLTTYEGAKAGAAANTGDTALVPAFEVQYLRRDGVVL